MSFLFIYYFIHFRTEQSGKILLGHFFSQFYKHSAMGHLLGGGGWTKLGGGCGWYEGMWGACEKVVDRDGLLMTADGTV